MRILKKQFSNILFVVFIVVLLFTPLGFKIKVYMNRLLSFSPSVIEKAEQKRITNFNWSLHSPELGDYNLESFKGKVVFINIWATWCPPCVAEMPSIQELYVDYKEDVVFICIAQDEQGRVNSYMEKNNFDFPVYYQKSNSPKALESDEIPTTFVIDKGGNIVVSKTGAADWNSDTTRNLLNKLLKQ